MRNLLLFCTVLLTAFTALYIGISRFNTIAVAAPVVRPAGAQELEGLSPEVQEQVRQASPMAAAITGNVPHIGSIQVLNGCNIEGAAKRMADFLRMKNFDVKDISNAQSWNYPATMVISRTTNMSLANEVGKHLKTDKVVLMRNNEQLYDVTVIVGPDFADKIK